MCYSGTSTRSTSYLLENMLSVKDTEASQVNYMSMHKHFSSIPFSSYISTTSTGFRYSFVVVVLWIDFAPPAATF